jgi:hypothetical protein
LTATSGRNAIQNGEIRYLSPSPLFPAVFTLCDVLGEIAMVDSDQGLRLARHIAGPELQIVGDIDIAHAFGPRTDYTPNSDDTNICSRQTPHFERQESEGIYELMLSIPG